MFKKTATATLIDPIVSINDWNMLYPRSFGHKTAAFGKIAKETSKYLLSHCTIMASVMTEGGDQDWKIKPECSQFVNQNNDAWSNEVLKLSYRTFVGAFNFLEHNQNTKQAKGHIIDAVLRKIHLTSGVWVYFVDILVATDLAHKDLVKKIRNGDIKYMSMGCVTDVIFCTACGQEVREDGQYCNHLKYNKGQFIPDEDGISRIVSELCGNKELPNGGVKFVEASWVEIPAFPGASLREIISNDWEGPRTKFTKDASELGHSKAASVLTLPEPSALMAEINNKSKW